MTARDGVSFIVPVFNKARYLPPVLAAIHAQRGDFHREYIFVDDGSTDDSVSQLRRLTEGWPNVTIIEQSNHGSAHATNRGIERAGYPFVKFVDADDILAHDATRLLLSVLRDRPDACLVYGGRIHFESEAEIDPDAPLPETAAVETIPDPLLAAMRNSLFNPSQFLARTDDLRAVGGCDERVGFSQEYSLTIRLAARSHLLRIGVPVAFIKNEVQGRLSNNSGRQLQRTTLACAYFLQDHPETPARYKRFACRRAAGRAWKFVRRHYGATMFSGPFALYIRSKLTTPADPAAFIKRCAQVFDREPPIRPEHGAAAAGDAGSG